MDATTNDDWPELVGTDDQVHYANRLRRSAAAVARYRGDAATLALIRSIADATVYIASEVKRRPLSEFVRTAGPVDTPEVARLRARMSAPWWASRKAAIDGAIPRLTPPW